MAALVHPLPVPRRLLPKGHAKDPALEQQLHVSRRVEHGLVVLAEFEEVVGLHLEELVRIQPKVLPIAKFTLEL